MNEPVPQSASGADSFDADAVRAILRRVVDPEIGINIVDLGLVYAIEVRPAGLRIELTMTSAACPMGDVILDEMRNELAAARPDDPSPEIVLVWDPPWDPAMMSPRAKQTLGW